MTNIHRALSALIVAALVSAACGGGNDASGPSVDGLAPGAGSVRAASGPDAPLASPVPAVSPAASPSPTPSGSPLPEEVPGGIAGASCPLGKGTPGAACSRSSEGRLFPLVDAALQQVIAQRPEIFDLTRSAGEGQYLVRNPDLLYEEMARRLTTGGVCASFDFERNLLQIKDGNDSSEDYDLMLSNGHLRRGAGSHLSTCLPASFPLTAQEVIDDIRVAFYSIECADGKAPPRNGEGLLRVECTGIVTATPKKADNTDVHERIHGPNITWTLTQADDYVKMHDFRGQPFNKYLTSLDPGFFTLCATVQGIQGCLKGEVLK